MAVERVTAEDVLGRLQRGERVYFVDTRNPQAWGAADVKLPEAIRVPVDEVDKHLADMPRDRAIVTYCT
jgi:hypothetical protein